MDAILDGKPVKLESLGGGKYLLQHFIFWEHCLGGQYYDYSVRGDVPTGLTITGIMVEVAGAKVEGLRLEDMRRARVFELVPRTILKNRPFEQGIIYVCLLNPLNLRGIRRGDVQLQMTVLPLEPPVPHARVVVNYAIETLLQDIGLKG